MLKILPVLALAATCLCVPSYAAEDDQTDLALRCGAGYLLMADDDSIAATAEDKDTLRTFGRVLITKGDTALAEAGMSEQERADLGYKITAEVDAALENDADPGFAPEECLAMVEAEAAKVEIPVDEERDARIDLLMTCGAGFLVSAGSLTEQGEEADAAMLEQLGTSQIEAAEELMIAAGLGDDARFQVSKMYGEQVGTQMAAGEDLAYDWDTCANAL